LGHDEDSGMSEAVSEAAARLERAVGRLAEVAARPRPAESVPPARLAELAGRLDGTLLRLRAALAELDEADGDADSEGGLPPGPGVTEPDAAPRPAEPAAPTEPAADAVADEDGLPATPQPTPHTDQER
jgi:hypothetical protein